MLKNGQQRNGKMKLNSVGNGLDRSAKQTISTYYTSVIIPQKRTISTYKTSWAVPNIPPPRRLPPSHPRHLNELTIIRSNFDNPHSCTPTPKNSSLVQREGDRLRWRVSIRAIRRPAIFTRRDVYLNYSFMRNGQDRSLQCLVKP